MSNKLTSIIPSGTSNYLTPSLSFNRLATDLVSTGVVGAFTNTSGIAPSTLAFAVNAQGTPNMTVAVTAGNAYVSATPSGGVAQTFGVTMDASENVTIASNSSGSTVYDFIYISLSATKLNNPAVNGLDVITLVTSRSSTAYNSALRTTTAGNSNGAQANCELIAVVTVANNAVSIVNGNITDGRVRSGAYSNPTIFSTPYKFSVYNNAGLASWSAVAANKKVPFDTEVFDTGGNYDAVTNYRFTAPIAGYYSLGGTVTINNATNALQMQANLFKNNAVLKTGPFMQGVGLNNTTASVGDPCVLLAAGDYVELFAWTSSSWGLAGGASLTYFSGALVSTT